MKTLRKSNRRATTLIELLVVLAIISLLATIAVPVYLSQLQRAKYAIARAEVRNIAEAQQQVAIIHGFYVPIHILNNIPNRTNNLGGASSSRDDFNNHGDLANVFVIDATIPLSDQTGAQQLALSSSDARVERMRNEWQGPFLNPQRVRRVGEDLAANNTGIFHLDFVVDPWGTPYRLYTDLGETGGSLPTGIDTQITITDDNLQVSSASSEADRFDRFAIVSFGPDGRSNGVGNQGDDIFYTFVGVTGNETRYSGF